MRSVSRLGEMNGVVDLLEVGLGQLAVARQRLVDDLVERRVVAGRVGVPDLVIARLGGLPQRLDLAKRDFRERHRAFVLVGFCSHALTPSAAKRPRSLSNQPAFRMAVTSSAESNVCK